MSVYRRKGSPFYYYEFQLDNRTYKGTTKCTNERDALAFERQERGRIGEQAKLDRLDPERFTVDAVFKRYWQTHGHKLSWAPTLKDHMIGLQAFLGGDKLFRDITNADVAAALESYAAETGRNNRPVTDSTVNRRLAVFRQIFLKARDEWDLQVQSVVFKRHMRKEPRDRVRHITVATAKALMDALPHHIMLMVAWSLATGCRLNETETLRWSRVNYETMQAEVDTKGGGTRFIDLSADAVAVLALCDRNRVMVFDSTNRRRLWEAAVQAAGLEDFHWHDLRHTFATWMGNRGGDIAVIMKALGHADVSTTMKYRHVIHADVKAAMGNMPTLIEGTVVPMKKQENGE